MPQNIKLQVSRNGGAPAQGKSGGVVVANGDLLVFSLADPTGVSKVRYRIYEYPNGFTVPLGWTEEDGEFVFTAGQGVPAPAVTLPAAPFWGDFLVDVLVDDGRRNGLFAEDLRDNSLGLTLPSVSGIPDFPHRESVQFDPRRSWSTKLKGLARQVDNLVTDGLAGAGAAASTVELQAGNGLSGGGTLAGNVSFAVDPHPDGSILVGPDGVQVGVLATDAQHGNLGGGTLHSLATTIEAGFMSSDDKVALEGLVTDVATLSGAIAGFAADIASRALASIVLTAGAGLTGGGDLTANRTFDVAATDASIAVSANGIAVGILEASRITNDSTVAGEFVDEALDALNAALGGFVPTSRVLTAGAGLTGTGDLTANRTFNVGQHPDGSIIVNADNIQVGTLASDAQHGERGGGALHALATGTTAGFFSAAGFSKLAGIEAGAQVNVVDGSPGDYATSDISNDSAVGGDFLDDALNILNTAVGARALSSVTIDAGDGLTGGGNLTASRTIHVGADPGGSIVVSPGHIAVGVLATDAQHGVRGGGTQHAVATALSAGFMSSAHWTKLEGIASGAQVNSVTSVFGRTGAVGAAASDYNASQIDNDSNVSGLFVDDALNTLNTAVGARALSSVSISAGSGLTGGGNLTASRTINVGAAADGSIVVTADAIGVGTLANDAQHGSLGGGAMHSLASALSPGFMSSSHWTKLEGIAAGAQVNTISSVFGRTGAIAALAGDYVASQIDNDSSVAGIFVDDALDTLNSAVGARALSTVNLIAGNGLTGGGTLAANRTFHVGANPDGSIVVAADTVGVGILATDVQHGTRGGGSLHALATTAVNGFMSSADKTKLNGIAAGAQVNTVTSVFGRTGAVGAAASDYDAAQIDFDPTSTSMPGTVVDVQAAIEDLDAQVFANTNEKAESVVQIIAGAGLTGGGNLQANRTLNVVAANPSITVNADSISVGVLQSDAQHGVRGGGTQHAVATTTVAGFMSAADKVLLNDLSTSAGSVSGPASVTDNAIVRWNTTSGTLVQNSGVTLSDTGVMQFDAAGRIGIGVAPATAIHVRGGSNPEIRLEEVAGSYLSMRNVTAATSRILHGASAGLASLEFDAIPADGASVSRFLFGAGTNTTGESALYVLRFNGTGEVNCGLGGNTSSFLNYHVGDLFLGSASNSADLIGRSGALVSGFGGLNLPELATTPGASGGTATIWHKNTDGENPLSVTWSGADESIDSFNQQTIVQSNPSGDSQTASRISKWSRKVALIMAGDAARIINLPTVYGEVDPAAFNGTDDSQPVLRVEVTVTVLSASMAVSARRILSFSGNSGDNGWTYRVGGTILSGPGVTLTGSSVAGVPRITVAASGDPTSTGKYLVEIEAVAMS